MNSQNRLYIETYGHDVTLTTYAEGAADDYEDKAITATATTVKALRKMFEGDVARSADGSTPIGDSVFWLKDTVTISDGDDGIASLITDRGKQFSVIQVDNQDNGIFAVTCQKVRT